MVIDNSKINEELICQTIEQIQRFVKNSDNDLAEFAVIPVDFKGDGKKEATVQEGYYLAIEDWIVPQLYKYTVRNLTGADVKLKLKLSLVIILLCPEYLTAWNIRREGICSNDADVVLELKFLNLLVKNKPNSIEIFNYRRWIVQHYNQNSSNKINLNEEFKFCTLASEKHKQNYYSWAYRLWLIDNCSVHNDDVLLDELKFTSSWIKSHVSDYSAFHYRQFILKRLTENHFFTQNYLLDFNFITQELDFIEDIYLIYPVYESMLFHRLYLLKSYTINKGFDEIKHKLELLEAEFHLRLFRKADPLKLIEYYKDKSARIFLGE